MKNKDIIIPDVLPTFDQLMKPLLRSLISLGGSGTIDEIDEKVFEITKLSENIINIPHKEEGGRSEVSYRLAWARTYLKKYGAMDNSSRGVWAIKCTQEEIELIDPQEVIKYVREQDRRQKEENSKNIQEKTDDDLDIADDSEVSSWKDNLLEVLLTIPPDSFERLTQRLLRESGFIQVEVTGKTGDGGIDGKGIIRIGGLMSFHVMFQCKRYKGSVTPGNIRDFRGALQGRADKGLFVTTGNYTRDAMKEAIRDGAPPIDLIDGNELCNKLKELKLGVETEYIEKISIINDFFCKI